MKETGSSYQVTKFVMLDIKYRFTCDDSELSEIIKKCQNIMTRIVVLKTWYASCPTKCRTKRWGSLYLFLTVSTLFKPRNSKFGPETQNLAQKLKIVTWIRNSVLRLIQICRIQWWCSLFLLFNGNTLFR